MDNDHLTAFQKVVAFIAWAIVITSAMREVPPSPQSRRSE